MVVQLKYSLRLFNYVYKHDHIHPEVIIFNIVRFSFWGGGGSDFARKIQSYKIHIVKLPNISVSTPGNQNYPLDPLENISGEICLEKMTETIWNMQLISQ